MKRTAYTKTGLTRSIGFRLAAVLVITLSTAGTAAAQNTAYGVGALAHPSNGNLQDSAFGFEALNAPTSGNGNTASGWFALMSNTTGNQNTAIGAAALQSNTTGFFNTATGPNALLYNTTGAANTATGWNALRQNTSSANTADGLAALEANSTGANNTAVGYYALLGNTKGGSNIGLGYQAGQNLTTGSYNIDVGNPGVAAESNTIRIGTKQTATYIAGISATKITGADVVVAANGRLGIVTSSARYKHDIHDMGGKSSALLKLRPVTFRYNNDPQNTLQYGLVAEEVAKVYPELVVYGADGKVETVRYSMLTSMLLNELQKQNSELRKQAAANQRQAGVLRRLSAQMVREKASTERSIAQLQANHDRELRAMQAAFEQRLSALERATGAAAPVRVKF